MLDYPIKELLDEIRDEIRGLRARLDKLADDAQALRSRLHDLERTTISREGPVMQRLNAMMTRDEVTAAISEHRGWTWTTLSKIVLTLAALVALLGTVTSLWISTHDKPVNTYTTTIERAP